MDQEPIDYAAACKRGRQHRQGELLYAWIVVGFWMLLFLLLCGSGPGSIDPPWMRI